MNEAQKILRKEMDNNQRAINDIVMDIKLKKEALEERKQELKEILEALMVLESPEMNYVDKFKQGVKKDE